MAFNSPKKCHFMQTILVNHNTFCSFDIVTLYAGFFCWSKNNSHSKDGILCFRTIFCIQWKEHDYLLCFFFQSNLTNESQNYGDILQESFLDSYANLTLKSVMLLKWFTRECDKVPYVLKTDDDMYINLKQLFQLTVANKKPNLLVSSSMLS